MATVIRDDLSDRLVHLTKGDGENAALTFFKILDDSALLGGTGFIKGGHTCVCFSEAPLAKLPQILAMPHENVRYRPYGLMFRKSWVFAKGGRPVIYQPDHDYDRLPPSHQHLHVRFYLGGAHPIDHTWEREWRIKTPRLDFTPEDVTVVVPTRNVSDGHKEHWSDVQAALRAQNPGHAVIPYPWHVVALEDLGIPIPEGLD
ncbi:hypothetical protein [Phenylobacterium zucineum]|uniref:hypothetical protein n=1 Tax=Phenylobacterium zucineum TaxID=284016 RepID=UPI0003050257|nr:hypothetical protein [Phenylobacterium zucineum]